MDIYGYITYGYLNELARMQKPMNARAHVYSYSVMPSLDLLCQFR